MVVPPIPAEASPLDPLLLLPLPTKLPSSPIPSLPVLLPLVDAHLNSPHTTPISSQLLPGQMRMLTRNSQILLNAARVGTAEARQGLDSVDVGLRGVEYELARVRDEIEKCAEYKPEYERLPLQDRQTFLDNLTAEASSESLHEGYEYALTTLRLEQELKETIEREELLAQLQKEQDALIKAKKEIKQRFDAVDTYLSDYAKTTNAVAKKIKDVVGSSS